NFAPNDRDEAAARGVDVAHAPAQGCGGWEGDGLIRSDVDRGRIVHRVDRDADGSWQGVQVTVVGLKSDAVNAIEVCGGNVGEVGNSSVKEAVTRTAQNRECQRAAFHVRTAQGDVRGRVFIDYDRLWIRHRSIVHRTDCDINGRRRGLESAVVD